MERLDHRKNADGRENIRRWCTELSTRRVSGQGWVRRCEHQCTVVNRQQKDDDSDRADRKVPQHLR